MLPAIILFALTYVLMLTFSKYRPYIALISGVLFIVTGMLPLGNIIPSLDFNVLLMIGGTMGLVQLFIDSRMPERLADITGIGILRKEGHNVSNGDFFKIGIPFTLAAIVPAYILIWILFGV